MWDFGGNMSKRSRLSSVEEVKVCVLLVEFDTDNVQAVMATLLLIAFVTYPPLHNETSDRMQDPLCETGKDFHCQQAAAESKTNTVRSRSQMYSAGGQGANASHNNPLLLTSSRISCGSVNAPQSSGLSLRPWGAPGCVQEEFGRSRSIPVATGTLVSGGEVVRSAQWDVAVRRVCF